MNMFEKFHSLTDNILGNLEKDRIVNCSNYELTADDQGFYLSYEYPVEESKQKEKISFNGNYHEDKKKWVVYISFERNIEGPTPLRDKSVSHVAMTIEVDYDNNDETRLLELHNRMISFIYKKIGAVHLL